jgi:putative hemolysin
VAATAKIGLSRLQSRHGHNFGAICAAWRIEEERMSGYRSRYRTRAVGAAEAQAAMALRAWRFRGAEETRDADAFDGNASHMLVEDAGTGRLVCCYRMTGFRDGSEIGRSYAASFYDLDGLARFEGPMLEIGRFCVDAGVRDPDVLRVAWAALREHVDREGIEMLFGCSSFAGTDAAPYREAFALLRARHLAPERWSPGVKASGVVRFGAGSRLPDLRAALLRMPPLLRTYLGMGGWVSDHAVIDRDLGTMHVFTGVETRKVPASRARSLRKPAVIGV